MKNKSNVTIFISIVLFGILSFFILFFIYDPLQLFHKHLNNKNTLVDNMRQQAAGIINNYEFDSVILGTSMLENTSSLEASKILGGSFINISASGFDFYERSVVLKYLLKKKKTKTIIYSLDSFSFFQQMNGDKSYPVHKFNYLYDENYINDFKAYVNTKYLKCILTFSQSKKCIGMVTELDRPNAWYKEQKHEVRFGGIDNWFKAKNNSQIKEAIKKISKTVENIKNGNQIDVSNIRAKVSKSKEYVDENILFYIKKYPNTKFILLFPPYSRLSYAMEAQYEKDKFIIYKEINKYLANKSDEYENLSLFAWGNNSFVDKIKNYKDPLHYNHKINSWMLTSIKNNEGLLNSSNINKYLETFTQKSLSYDLITIGNKIDNYLKSDK
mgnify:CR=1 FL=1